MRAQGHTDIPLNETGRRQAELLGKRMSGETWDVVYSSDLGRALETARKAVEQHGLVIATDVRLREVYLGEVEGTTEEERLNRWGPRWKELDLGQESRDSVALRGVQALADYADRHPGKRILVVSHGGWIGNTMKKLVPHFETSMHLQNTSVTLVRRTEHGRWECDLFNCTRHLA
ncbi:histidine phosphatase family protein [Paenibacillus ginsengarvi]|uniref:Histidine phosphatase family protein n=2 Tax=Paenibacillus ginsengarvi TaxID=400777 RepID=A0A3B0CLG3_9BACL|nr:histidine phosphatase family protein [Paenibacillus ginsengarvi]